MHYGDKVPAFYHGPNPSTTDIVVLHIRLPAIPQDISEATRDATLIIGRHVNESVLIPGCCESKTVSINSMSEEHTGNDKLCEF